MARNIALFISQFLIFFGFTEFVLAIEKYLAFIMGRGSGSGWDTEGEIRSIIKFIRVKDPVVFDVGAVIPVMPCNPVIA